MSTKEQKHKENSCIFNWSFLIKLWKPLYASKQSNKFFQYCKNKNVAQRAVDSMTFRLNQFNPFIDSQNSLSVQKISYQHLSKFKGEYNRPSVPVKKSKHLVPASVGERQLRYACIVSGMFGGCAFSRHCRSQPFKPDAKDNLVKELFFEMNPLFRTGKLSFPLCRDF